MTEATDQTQALRKPRRGDLILPASDRHDDAPARRSRVKVPPPKPAGRLAYLSLILLTVGCYLPIFQSGLIWSEYDQVERSASQSMEHWTEAWTLEMIRGEDPLTLSSYFLEKKLPLPPAAAHHAINLLLHLAAAVLLLKTLDALKLPAAFSATLIFALHPAVLQTVFWPGYRSELFGLLLLLAALFFGVRNRNARDYACLIVISALAYLLHPATLLLPLVLGLCIFYQNKSFHLKDYNRLLPLLCLALFLGVWTHPNRIGLEVATEGHLSFYGQNMFFYLKQALLPVDLALFHPFNLSGGYNVGAQNSLLPFLLFIPFYILIAINHRKAWARGLLLGLTAYLLLCAYAVTAKGTFIDGSLAHENHLQYISLPILVALVVCSLGGLAHNMGSAGKILWSLAFTVFILLQLAVTASYAYTVSDRAQMWHNLSEKWPNAWLPKLALIHTLQESEEGNPLLPQSEIIKILEDILNQQPDLIAERKRLAHIYREEGQNTNALLQYRRILRDSSPDREFLIETAEFYDTLGLTWDASNVRERIAE